MKSPRDPDDLDPQDDLLAAPEAQAGTDDDDDLPTGLLDDDDLDAYATLGGGKTSGSSESQLSAKYADYLMWLDTGSSHDEALDLASMSEEEFTAAEAADEADRSDSFGTLDEDDDFDDDEEDDGYSGGKRGGRSTAADTDDY